MPENAILLVPIACLIAIGILMRRETRAPPTAAAMSAGTLEITLECHTGPARQALQLLNTDLERTRALLADVESGAAAIGKVGQRGQPSSQRQHPARKRKP